MLTRLQVNGGTLRGTTSKQETSSITQHATPWVPPKAACFHPLLLRRRLNQAWRVPCSQRRDGVVLFFFTGHIVILLRRPNVRRWVSPLAPFTVRGFHPVTPSPFWWLWQIVTQSLCMLCHTCGHISQIACISQRIRPENSCMPCTQDYEIFTGWLHRHANRERENCADIFVKMFTFVFFQMQTWPNLLPFACPLFVCLFACLFFFIFHLLIWRIKISRAQKRKLLFGSLLFCKKKKKKKVLSSQKLLLLISPYQAKTCWSCHGKRVKNILLLISDHLKQAFCKTVLVGLTSCWDDGFN